MNRTSRGAANGAPDRSERLRHWMAALLTALLHVLLVLLVMPPPPPIAMNTSHGGAGGSRMQVTLIDDSLSAPPPEPEPPVHKPVPRKKPRVPRAIARPPSTPVVEASMPMPQQAADAPTAPPTTEPEPPDEPPETAEPPHEAGRPPGMRTDDNARASAALAAKLGGNRGRSNNPAPAGPDLGVDGFHVYYELVNENRLRAWREQGMTELFLPLPGTRRLMVCPLEVALRRGSGACRMVEQDSPALKSIGDARDVIDIQRVYQLGDEVWSGPEPYR